MINAKADEPQRFGPTNTSSSTMSPLREHVYALAFVQMRMDRESGACSSALGTVPTFLLVWGRTLIGVALAGAVWLYGTYIAPPGGLDSPCLFSLAATEGSTLDTEWTWLPPGERCVEERPNGTEREETYPGPVTFAVAVAAFVVPFLVRRRDRVRGPSRAGAKGERG